MFPGSLTAGGALVQRVPVTLMRSEEVAVKHRALFFPEGQEPLSRDHEATCIFSIRVNVVKVR